MREGKIQPIKAPLDIDITIWYSIIVNPNPIKALVFCLFRYLKTDGYANEANLRERGFGLTIAVRFNLQNFYARHYIQSRIKR